MSHRAIPMSYAASIHLVALFSAFSCIRASSSENLYTASSTKDTVVQISPSGALSTYDSGLVLPSGLAFNSSFDLFVAGKKNDVITEFKPGGTGSTFVTLNTADVGKLPGNLEGMAFNSLNDLFVATGDHLIVEITPGGTISQFASAGSTSSLFGVVVNGSGDVFASDQTSADIYEYNPSGNLINTIVDPGGIKDLNGITIGNNGTLYAVGENPTTSAGEVIEIPKTGPDVVLAAGVSGPEDVAVDGSGNLFVLAANNQISEIPLGGSPSLLVSSGLAGGSFLTFAPTPEPSALTLLLAAGLSGAAMRRRRKHATRLAVSP